MATISESSWTSFLKKLKKELDDGPLVKALARYEKTSEDKHDERLEALDNIVEQVKKQVVSAAKLLKEKDEKKKLSDKEHKEVKDKLYEILDEAEKQQKTVRADKAKAESAADEEADSPVLLTTKMIPLLRELRKGESTMNAMICTAGKNTAVLIMRKAISPGRKKMLSEAVDAAGGAKFIVGEVTWEQKALTFVVKSPAGGLAKRIRAALLAQVELRFKVRVRGDDGEDSDGEEENEGDAEALAGAGIPKAPPLPPGSQPQQGQQQGGGGDKGGESEEQEGEEEQTDPLALAWAQRGEATRKRVLEALSAQHPEASKLRALIAFASEKAEEAGDFKAALAALERIDKLLGSTTQPDPNAKVQAQGIPPAPPLPPGSGKPGTPTTPPPGEGGSKPKIAPAIVYTQTRLAWVATRGKIQGEMKKLEDAILAHYKGQVVMPDVTKSVRKLDRVLENFDESLLDNLDNALNTADPDEKTRWHDEARGVIKKYQDFLATDPMVQELDSNPFVPIAVQATLSKTLSTLASKIV